MSYDSSNAPAAIALIARPANPVLASALLIGVLTAGVHAVTLAKDLFVAFRFGTSDALEAFLIAYLLPSVGSVFIAGAFGSAFMPVYIKARERGAEGSASLLYGSAYFLFVVVLVIATLSCVVLLPLLLPIIAAGFPSAKRALTVDLGWIVAPTLFLSGIATLWTTALNATYRFAAAAVAPALLPAVMIAFIAGYPGETHALAWGALGGSLLHAGFLAAFAAREGLALLPRWKGMTPELRQALSQYWPMIGGAILLSLTNIVDQAMAAALRPGDVAALSYGGKVVSALASVVAMAMATAIMPLFSERIARGDFDGVRRALGQGSRSVLLVTIPATIATIALSAPLIRLLFERGAFGPSDTALVAWVQQLGALQIPFYASGLLFARLLSALGRNDVLYVGAGMTLAVKVVLNIALIPALGVAGIALATSAMYAFSLGYLCLRSLSILRVRERAVRAPEA